MDLQLRRDDQPGCWASVLNILQSCGLCQGRGYETAFSEENTETAAGSVQASYQAPVPASGASSSRSHLDTRGREALLPKGGNAGAESSSAIHHAPEPGSRLRLGEASGNVEEPQSSKAHRRIQSYEHLAMLTTARSGKLSPIGQRRVPSGLSLADNDDECCPTCLEAYTTENPKILTKCQHAYHLSCIYEWLERSNTCPVCGKAMSFEEMLA
ncbi:hypothetical protein WJX84_001548 [Apatococcus fuscideae]|uniref:RING-type E3 ubiquitin transferase n=1 Tax=Apatococcus fuscideae TaxID=2026836 RepID=A0AAW1T4W5_9CHLO